MNQKHLFDAITSISDTYIEEAAVKRRTSLRPIAAAAILVLFISTFFLIPGQKSTGESIPFFAIRAYASDGTVATLDTIGDSALLQANSGNIPHPFKGKQTYSFDVSLGEYTGSADDIIQGDFYFRHNGKRLYPGESDDEVQISWIIPEKEGEFFGYNITGWCKSLDVIDITITDENGRILHQKYIRVSYDEGYTLDVRNSYTYLEDITTDALIDLLLAQDYLITTIYASSNDAAFHFVYNGHGGFHELGEKEDGASKLLARYLAVIDQEDANYQSWLIGLMLSRSPFWGNLTPAEQAVFEPYRSRYGPFGESIVPPDAPAFTFPVE